MVNTGRSDVNVTLKVGEGQTVSCDSLWGFLTQAGHPGFDVYCRYRDNNTYLDGIEICQGKPV